MDFELSKEQKIEKDKKLKKTFLSCSFRNVSRIMIILV
jgi:hypothetical protein